MEKFSQAITYLSVWTSTRVVARPLQHIIPHSHSCNTQELCYNAVQHHPDRYSHILLLGHRHGHKGLSRLHYGFSLSRVSDPAFFPEEGIQDVQLAIALLQCGPSISDGFLSLFSGNSSTTRFCAELSPLPCYTLSLQATLSTSEISPTLAMLKTSKYLSLVPQPFS
ncbi:hypothetical protein H8959_021891 [Pygathrix nigripes]